MCVSVYVYVRACMHGGMCACVRVRALGFRVGVISVSGQSQSRYQKVCQNWQNLELIQFTEFHYYR